MQPNVTVSTRAGAAVRLLRTLLLALCLMGGAVSAAAIISPAMASADGAGNFMQSLGDRAVRVMNAKHDQRQGLAQLLDDGLDIPGIGRFALGSFLRQSNPQKVEEYLMLFRDYVLMSYPTLMGKLNLKQFQILSTKAVDAENSYVVTRIGYGEKETVEVGWYVREAAGGRYKIQDVQLEGYSLRTFQRAKFEKILRDRWIDGLIRIMQSWVANGREEPYLQ
jgi:phospholipid transport system substrate-binding protein